MHTAPVVQSAIVGRHIPPRHRPAQSQLPSPVQSMNPASHWHRRRESHLALRAQRVPGLISM